MRTISRRVAHLALAAILAVALCLVVLIALGPWTGEYRTLTVLSASMRPTFGPGSVVIVRPTAVTDLEVGDVITYRTPLEDRRVVTHRIVEIVEVGERPVVRTQGDANNAADPWLTRLEGGVAWRTESSLPFLGYAVSALRSPLLGRVLVLLCPFVLCLLWLADIWRRPVDDAGHPSVVEPEPARAARPNACSGRARHRSGIDTLLAVASGTDRVLRWTDEVVSGRRWQRRRPSHA